MNRIACFHSLHFASFVITTLPPLMTALHFSPYHFGYKKSIVFVLLFYHKMAIENLQNRKKSIGKQAASEEMI